MKTAIIGAGICGLTAARHLTRAGIETVVFEKSRGLGGRVATRSKAGFIWDTGATSIAPRGRPIREVLLNELPTEALVSIERPIYTHRALRVSPGNSPRINERFVYSTGIQTLAKYLADGLNVRLETQIEGLAKDPTGYGLRLSDGTIETYDSVILTPPVPQASALLWGLQDARPVAHANYRPCLTVNLGYETPSPDVPYHALIDTERIHPLTWLSLESLKSPGRAPEGGSAFAAQLSATFSWEHYLTPDEELIRLVADYLVQLYGATYQTPTAFTIMRWKYAQPTGIANFDEVNPIGSTLIVASDGLLGGHIEDAYDVGVLAAQRIQRLL